MSFLMSSFSFSCSWRFLSTSCQACTCHKKHVNNVIMLQPHAAIQKCKEAYMRLLLSQQIACRKAALQYGGVTK